MAPMSASRIVPILLLGLLAFAALVHGLMGRKNQAFDGLIVQDVSTYEFYPNAKDCNYRGTPYVLLPNDRFRDVVAISTDAEHIDRLFHGTWRARLNGNLSPVGWHKYRKNYWRELSVNYVIDAVEMSCGDTQPILAQHGSVTVDWKAELAKAKAGIGKNPKSASWHNQAGVAYDALGDFQNAVKEIKLASTLDPSDPIHDYTLYAIYKTRAMFPEEQRQLLLDALEKDSNNPVGRFEFAHILEEEKHWADALREYQVAKRLASSVKGPMYADPRGNAYSLDAIREEVDKAIERVAKLNESAQQQK
jgi:tetratricopeptide (TPR) repeat protein